MEDTFRRAARIRTLPRVAKMERKMFRAIRKYIRTPGGIFAIADAALVLFAIGFENPDQALSSVSSPVRLQRTDEHPRTK